MMSFPAKIMISNLPWALSGWMNIAANGLLDSWTAWFIGVFGGIISGGVFVWAIFSVNDHD